MTVIACEVEAAQPVSLLDEPELIQVPMARPVADLTAGELIRSMPRESLTLLALLSAITHGLYLVVWFDRRAKAVTRHSGRPVVEDWLMQLTWIASVLSASSMVLEWACGLSPAVLMLGGLVDNVAAALLVVLSWQLAGRLNELLVRSEPGGGGSLHTFSRFWTLLLNAGYLQWKINRMQDSAAHGTAS